MRLTVVTGPMFSGKSHEMIRRVRRAVIANKRVLVVKPSLDRRYGAKEVVTHDGNAVAAYPIPMEHPEKILGLAAKIVPNMLAIDEVQFFDPSLLTVLHVLSSKLEEVVVSGLDRDYRGEPFPMTMLLMAHADEVLKLSAVCVQCKKDAACTQMVIDGEPFTEKINNSVIRIGGREIYEARCRVCWVGPN